MKLHYVGFYLLTLVGLLSTIIIGIIGCSRDDPNEWVGTWSLESIDGESIQEYFEAFQLILEIFEETDVDISYTDDWTFNDDGTWHREATLVVANEDNTAETTSTEVMGTYALSGTDYTISVKAVEGDLGSDGPNFGYEGTDTGTWLITGGTLTLTSDTEGVLGFKKK